MPAISNYKLSEIINHIKGNPTAANFIISDCAVAAKLVDYYPEFIKYVPEELITDDLIISALSSTHYHKNSVPDKYITNDIIIKVLEKNGASITNIPNYLLTYDFCKIAVEQSPYSILYIKVSSYITEELFKMAVEKNPNVLVHVHGNIKTKEEWYTPDVIEKINTLDDIKIFQSPLLKYMSSENILRLIKKHPNEVIIHGANDNDKLHNEEMYLELIKINKQYIKCFKPTAVSKKFVRKHILSNGLNTALGVHLLSEEMFTNGVVYSLICKEINENDVDDLSDRIYALRYVPKYFFSYDNYVMAFSHYMVKDCELPLDVMKQMLLEGLEVYKQN